MPRADSASQASRALTLRAVQSARLTDRPRRPKGPPGEEQTSQENDQGRCQIGVDQRKPIAVIRDDEIQPADPDQVEAVHQHDAEPEADRFAAEGRRKSQDSGGEQKQGTGPVAASDDFQIGQGGNQVVSDGSNVFQRRKPLNQVDTRNSEALVKYYVAQQIVGYA